MSLGSSDGRCGRWRCYAGSACCARHPRSRSRSERTDGPRGWRRRLDRRGDPNSRARVHRHTSDADSTRPVVIGRFGKARGSKGLNGGLDDWHVFLVEVPHGRHGAMLAMPGVAPEVEVRLQADEVRQHLIKAPAAVTASNPAVEVARGATRRESGQPGGATQQLLSSDRARRSKVGLRLVAPIVQLALDRPAVAELLGQV